MGMRWYDRIVSMDGTLHGRRRTDRSIMFVVAAFSLLFELVFVVRGLLRHSSPPLALPFYVAALATNAAVVLACLLRRPLLRWHFRLYVAIGFCNTLAFDLHMRTISQESVWPLLVLLADLSLVLRLGRRFSLCLVTGTTLWIVVSSIESATRFGLFDAPGTDSTSTRLEYLEERCGCAVPPCKRNTAVAMQEMCFSVLVLVTDFLATRGFAERAERERRSMAHTISTVEEVAVYLAGYDVDTVAEMLQSAEGQLPEAMHAALRRLEQNLRAYRPYLARSCLPVEGGVSRAGVCADDTDVSHNSEHLSSKSSSFFQTATATASGTITAVAPTRPLWELREARASVLTLNVRGTLQHLADDARGFAEQFGRLLEVSLVAVEHRRGIIDVFVGDRILASFNTLRACGVHASAAAHCAGTIARTGTAGDPTSPENSRLSACIGVATGRALCGDMGCTTTRRFSLLGPLAVTGSGMERAARALGATVLCNATLQSEAELEHALLLLPRRVMLVKEDAHDSDTHLPALAGGGEGCVYELLVWHGRESTANEWLYELGRGAAEWADYNAAVRAFLSGCTVEEAVQRAGAHGAEVREAIQRLGHCRTPLAIYV